MNLVSARYVDGVVSLPGSNKLAVRADWQPAMEHVLGRGGDVMVGFRPEAGMISDQGALAGQVYATDMHGAFTMLHVNLNETDIVHIRCDRLFSFPIGASVQFDINPEMVRFFDPNTEMAITRRSIHE
jgi:ABC-type sugar transport system ATPase subunit